MTLIICTLALQPALTQVKEARRFNPPGARVPRPRGRLPATHLLLAPKGWPHNAWSYFFETEPQT